MGPFFSNDTVFPVYKRIPCKSTEMLSDTAIVLFSEVCSGQGSFVLQITQGDGVTKQWSAGSSFIMARSLLEQIHPTSILCMVSQM